MRANIHPSYNEIKATCSCGFSFITRSTLTEDLQVEVCSSCHPFYTGKQKVMDTGGRVKRFEDRYRKQESPAPKTEAKLVKTEPKPKAPAKKTPTKAKVASKKPTTKKSAEKKET